MNFVLNFLQNGEKDIISQAQGEISLKGISFDFVFHSGQRVNQSLCFYGFNGKDLVPIEGKIYK
jgi:hypothetical protein